MAIHPIQHQPTSLMDIRVRKELLRESIESDDAKIKELWNSLFNIPNILSKEISPSKRLNSLFSIGINTLDGAILAWKLYKKFKRR